jgi:hypothetical protein
MSKNVVLIIVILLLIIIAIIEGYMIYHPKKPKPATITTTPLPTLISPSAPTYHPVNKRRKRRILQLTDADKNQTFDLMIGDIVQIELIVPPHVEYIASQKGKALRISHTWRPVPPIKSEKMMIEYKAVLNSQSVLQVFRQVDGQETQYMEFRFVVGHTDFLTGFPSLYQLDMNENNKTITLKVGQRIAIDLPNLDNTDNTDNTDTGNSFKKSPKWFLFKKTGNAMIVDKPFRYVCAVFKTADPKDVEICLCAYRPGKSTYIFRYGDRKTDFTIHFQVVPDRTTIHRLFLENDRATVSRGDIIEFMLMGTKTSTQSWWNIDDLTGNSIAMVGAWNFHPLFSTKDYKRTQLSPNNPQLGYFSLQFTAYHLGTTVADFKFVTNPSMKKTFTIDVVS